MIITFKWYAIDRDKYLHTIWYVLKRAGKYFDGVRLLKLSWMIISLRVSSGMLDGQWCRLTECPFFKCLSHSYLSIAMYTSKSLWLSFDSVLWLFQESSKSILIRVLQELWEFCNNPKSVIRVFLFVPTLVFILLILGDLMALLVTHPMGESVRSTRRCASHPWLYLVTKSGTTQLGSVCAWVRT